MVDLQLFERLEATSSSNEKKEILAEAGEMEQLLIKLALDSDILFRINTIPDKLPESEPMPEDEAFMYFLGLCDGLGKKKALTKEDRESIHWFLSRCNPLQQKWFKRILLKDLQVGIAVKSLTKVFPGLVPYYMVARALEFDPEEHEDELTNRRADAKLDGVRGTARVENGEVLFRSRGGIEIVNFPRAVEEMSKLPDGMYDGEIYWHTEDGFRKLMQYLKTTEPCPDEISYRFIMFDYVPLEEWADDSKERKRLSTVVRRDRLVEALLGAGFQHNRFDAYVAHYGERLGTTYLSHRFDRIEHLDAGVQAAIQAGYEGLMLKDLLAPYVKDQSTHILKAKQFHSTEGVVIGYYEGKKPSTRGTLGGLTLCHTFEGKEVTFNVGGGFSKDLRKEIWSNPETYLGRIVEFRYQERTKTGKPRFLSFLRFREDMEARIQ